MTMHKSLLGRGVPQQDVTLADYIARKQEKPVLTFDEWWHRNNDDSLCYECARQAWQASKEN